MRAQLLDAPRPADLLAVVQQLTLLQIDPTAAIAPNADLVAWSRLGSSYEPAQLQRGAGAGARALRAQRVHPPHRRSAAVPGGRGQLAAATSARASGSQANESFHRDVLDRLRDAGPLMSRDIPDTSVVPWPSSGWTNNRNVTQMLEFLMLRCEVAIAGRRGRQRIWDLAERVYPADQPELSVEEAERLRDERRLRALGIARATGTARPRRAGHRRRGRRGGDRRGRRAGRGASIRRRSAGRSSGRTALLSPFDRLVHDRGRALDLFEFEYTLEMYKPKAKRRWGYFALPILHEDRARREARRDGGPQGGRARRARDPRGRPLHARDPRRRAQGARGSRGVARPEARRASLSARSAAQRSRVAASLTSRSRGDGSGASRLRFRRAHRIAPATPKSASTGPAT